MTESLSPAHPICMCAEVEAALNEKGPVVALETSVVAQGLPSPQNLSAARAWHRIIEAEGAAPAAIAVMDGCAWVGLSGDQLTRLASLPAAKASSRDLALHVSQGSTAATTVAGALAVMRSAGLKVLATGGIGGVHHGSAVTFDVSADLLQLATTQAVVVASGAKSVLDLPRTVEALEAAGVPVLGLRTDEFPAFYSRQSGLPVSAQVVELAQVGRLALAHWRLGLAGILLAVPVPEAAALEPAEASAATAEALSRAHYKKISGPQLTPFLLTEIARLTEGRSLAANLALLENNARVAAQLAVEIAHGS